MIRRCRDDVAIVSWEGAIAVQYKCAFMTCDVVGSYCRMVVRIGDGGFTSSSCFRNLLMSKVDNRHEFARLFHADST